MRQALLALALALGILAIVPASPAAASATCTIKYSYNEKVVDPGVGYKEVKIYMDVGYYHCRNDQNGNRWVEPNSFTVGYDVLGTNNVDCTGFFHWFDGVKFNPYFSDRDGHSINPGEKTVACKADSRHEVSYDIARDPQNRLHNCNGAPPKWDVDGRVVINGDSDKHFSIADTMWGFIGPFPNSNC